MGLGPGSRGLTKGEGMTQRQLGENPVVNITEGSVGLVWTEFYTFAEPPDKLILENGSELGPITVAYETYGELNDSGENVLGVEHALTANAHAAGRHNSDDKYPGWWDVMIGPGRAFDTDKYFVVCSNILGSCYGTTGPLFPDENGEPYHDRFPLMAPRDSPRISTSSIAATPRTFVASCAHSNRKNRISVACSLACHSCSMKRRYEAVSISPWSRNWVTSTC